MDDNAECNFETADGVIETMTASRTHYGREDNVKLLYGTKGQLRLYENPAHPVTVLHGDGTETYYDAGEIQTNDHQTQSGLIVLWMKCLTENGPTPMDGAEVLRSMRAVFAAVRSSEEGRTIEIPEN